MTSATISTTAQLQLTQIGGPFKIAHTTQPDLEPEQVLVRQSVIALNPVDAKQRDLGIGISRWPRVLGIEGGGVVEDVGSAVHDLQRGDEVAGAEGSGIGEDSFGGAFQERVAVPRRMLFRKPRNIALEEAASLPICFLTAVSGITHSLQLSLPFLPFLQPKQPEAPPPSSILVLGGSSATGAATIQLLRRAYPGLPILATSSAKHHARLGELGATHAVDYNSSSLVADLRAVSPAATGVDVVVDCVGASAIQTDISNVFRPDGLRKYAAVRTGTQIAVPDGVEFVEVHAWNVLGLPGAEQLIPALTQLVEEATYRVPLPVRVAGHGLEELPGVLDQVMRASGEKIVVTV